MIKENVTQCNTAVCLIAFGQKWSSGALRNIISLDTLASLVSTLIGFGLFMEFLDSKKNNRNYY